MTVLDSSDQFGISRRQVYRDRAQRRRGIRSSNRTNMEKGPGICHWDIRAPADHVSPYEVMTLHFARRHLDYLTGTPLTDDLDSLIAKIEAGLPHKVLNYLVRIDQIIFFLATDRWGTLSSRGLF